MIPHHFAPRDWVGETAVLVGSGPSTAHVDLSLLAGKRVIAVSHGYLAVKQADLLIAGGRSFYKKNKLDDFKGRLIVIPQHPSSNYSWVSGLDERYAYMIRAGTHGLCNDPGGLCGSESSVMLAINYAVHRGVSRILLLGCDGKPGNRNQRRFGVTMADTPDALDRYRVQERAMKSQVPLLAKLGIEIWNCSPGTALTIYPIAPLERFA